MECAVTPLIAVTVIRVLDVRVLRDLRVAREAVDHEHVDALARERRLGRALDAELGAGTPRAAGCICGGLVLLTVLLTLGLSVTLQGRDGSFRLQHAIVRL